MDIPVLYIIITITVLVSLKGFNDPDFKYRMMYIPYKVNHDRQFYRNFSHLLVHADMPHLIFNMITLYFMGIGPNNNGLEPIFNLEYGPVRGEFYFVLLYLAGGLFATLIPFIRHKNNNSYLSLGASGAVSAVLFATIICAPELEFGLLFLPIPIKGWLFGLLYLAFEFWADKRGNSHIAHDAHIGGALFGILFILVIDIDKGRQFIETIF